MAVNIYFAGSIRGGREDQKLYKKIVQQLKTYGTVFTEHVADPNIENGETELSEKEIHDRDMAWMKQSHVLVAECTQPSLGVGYEIAQALARNVKVLVLFRPDSGRRLSAMKRGAEDGKLLICKDYKEEDMPEILKTYFAGLQ